MKKVVPDRKMVSTAASVPEETPEHPYVPISGGSSPHGLDESDLKTSRGDEGVILASGGRDGAVTFAMPAFVDESVGKEVEESVVSPTN